VAPADTRGAALLDLLPALALVALVAATTIPVVAGAMDRERVTIGAQYLAARLAHAQMEALRRGVFVALRVGLEPHDTTLQLFADGNGNGVLTREIGEGIDRPLGPVDRLAVRAPGVSLRLNQRVTDAGGAGWLEAGSDPLRIGHGSLISCSPTGSLTSGTLYVASTLGPQLAVRITGSTGRVRVLRFDPATTAWRP
jgi:Tfp pilus assembly protein FimT